MKQVNTDDSKVAEGEALGAESVGDCAADGGEEPTSHYIEGLVSSQLPEKESHFPLPIELFETIRPQLNQRWLVKGLLMSGSSTVIFGPPGAGKSFFAIDIALHIATGRAWFDRDVTQGVVVYIAGEGQTGVRNRITAWKKLNGINADVPFALIPIAVDLFDPKADIEKLSQTLKMLKVKWGSIAFIVIDTLAATIGGGDENGHDMMTYLSNIIRLCQPHKCSVAIVTHVPHVAGPRPRPRGHSSLIGSMDTAIYVHTIGTGGSRVAEITKQKDDDPGAAIFFRLESVEIGRDDDGDSVTSCFLIPDVRVSPNNRAGAGFNEKQSLAYTILRSKIEAEGREPADAVPEAKLDGVTRVCPESAWKDGFVKAISTPDTTPDTLRKSFERTRDNLLSREIVGRWNKWVWLVD